MINFLKYVMLSLGFPSKQPNLLQIDLGMLGRSIRFASNRCVDKAHGFGNPTRWRIPILGIGSGYFQ